MNSRLSEILLAVLVVMVGVGLMLQIQSNTRVEFLLQDIRNAPRAPAISLPIAPTPASARESPGRGRTSAEGPDSEPQAQPEPQPAPVALAEPEQSEGRDADESPNRERKSAEAQAPPTRPEPEPQPEPESQPADPVWQNVGPTMTLIIDQLLKGRYDPVVERFDATMAAALPQSQLADVMNPLRARVGSLEAVTQHNRITLGLPDNQFCYQVHARTTTGRMLLFTITLDQSDRITGLFVKEAR